MFVNGAVVYLGREHVGVSGRLESDKSVLGEADDHSQKVYISLVAVIAGTCTVQTVVTSLTASAQSLNVAVVRPGFRSDALAL
jgi:hypothetical protein